MERQRVHLIISGHVQGVAYRASAQRCAKQLALTGWVRNQRNGNVEVIAEGNDKQLAEFIHWAERGPRFAVVDNLLTEYSAASDEFSDFLIIN